MKISKFFFSSHKKAARIAASSTGHPFLPPIIGQDVGTKLKDRGDAHISFMPSKKVEKIGGKSMLDK
jgi:hypothetical protein